MFVDRKTLISSDSERLAAEVYLKLMQKRHVPHRVLSTGPENLKSLEEGIDISAIINVSQLWNNKVRP